MGEPQKPATSKFQPLPAGKKVFDIVRPGKSPALPTSRPVIIGHKPAVADDQFVASKPSRLAADPDDHQELLDSAARFKGVVPAAERAEQSPGADAATVANDQLKADSGSPKKVPRVISSAVLSREVDLSVPDPGVLAAPEPSNTTVEELPEADAEPQASPSESSEQETPMVDTEKSDSVAAEPAQNEMPETPATASTASDLPVSTPADSAAAQEPAGSASLLKPFTEQEMSEHMSQDDVLENTNAPLFDHQQMVVSHHGHHLRVWQFLLVFLAVVILAMVAFNFLLDAKVLTIQTPIPHTNWIK